jgi:hypothetical protein
VLELGATDVIVATDASPAGAPVPIAWVQDAIDTLYQRGELRISVPALGHRRSAFIGQPSESFLMSKR